MQLTSQYRGIFIPQPYIPLLPSSLYLSRRQVTKAGLGILVALAFSGPLLVRPHRARGNPLLLAVARTALFAAVTWLVNKVLDETWAAHVERLGAENLVPAGVATTDPKHGPRHNYFAADWALPPDYIGVTRSTHGYWFSGDGFCRADANHAIPDHKDWNRYEIEEVKTKVESGDLEFPPHFCNFRKLPTEAELQRIRDFCKTDERLRQAYEERNLGVGYVRPMRYGKTQLLGADIRIGDGEPEFKLLL